MANPIAVRMARELLADPEAKELLRQFVLETVWDALTPTMTKPASFPITREYDLRLALQVFIREVIGFHPHPE